MTFEEWLAQKGQQVSQATGGIYGMGPSNTQIPPPGTQQQIAQYARQNVSTPTDLDEVTLARQQALQKLANSGPIKQNAELLTQQNNNGGDLTGYKPSQDPTASQRQFPNIRKTVSATTPTLNQDVENTTSPNKALTPEQEAALNQKMQDDEDDDEKKQFAENNNNRSGSAEGSYSP